MADSTGLDKILRLIGDFGNRQVVSFISIFFITVFNCACHMAYVFTAMETESRCSIPGCDEKNAEFVANYIHYAIPFDGSGKLRKCEMYNIKNDTYQAHTCSAEQFESQETIFCEEFVFKHEGNSIAKEYNLLCESDAWKLSLVGTINTLGMLSGICVSGLLSDRYGRKAILIFGMALGGLVGVSKTLSPTYEVFCFMEFLESFMQSGSHDSIFILAMELVIPEHRFLTSCLFFSICASGQMLLALVAWMVKDWRLIIYILYGPCIFFVFLHPFIIESIRWQLSKGDIDRAKDSLNKIAKSNKKTIPSSYIYSLQRNIIENREKCQTINFTQMIKSRVLFWRLIISTFLWISCALLFYGLSLSSVTLSGNHYLNFLLVSFIEIPAYWLMLLVAGKMKRKTLLIGSFFLTSGSCFFSIFLYSAGLIVESAWLLLVLHCFGKFGVAFAFNMVHIMMSEMFPTPLRQTTIGLCSMIGRIGCMISPQISLMGLLWVPLPKVIFSSTAALAGILAFLLPETIGVKLPDTIEEAEEIEGLKTPTDNGIKSAC
ncbi:solute carrier family 22 member 15-like [Coccinella septempunctata]|uniref:solute carrier family 22 member 15-like n=1 Tax=Coccinella septempunctata TaxID=41139 RepID=UPI001D07FB38|nr:solute carrier family 22 member 15-like [Coccinella septempunctata]